jgi:terminase, large subunit
MTTMATSSPQKRPRIPPERYARGLVNLRKARLAARQSFRPPPKLSLSAWANRYAYLSPETSAHPGKFRAWAYQDGIMGAVTDNTVRQVTVMKSARIGYTRVLDHVVGYFIHQDPSPILVVQPRVEDAEDYSRTEILPMLRDTPVLAVITGDLKSRDSDQRILKRMFKNGASVSFVGANSPAGFRRITARIVCFDEIDAYPLEGAGHEGDQITLGTKRTDSFWDRKIILGSTPTLKDASRIEKAYLESDQRRYYVPCPQCGHEQTLRWENLKWDKTESGEHLPETAHFVCEASGCIVEERDKPMMIQRGRWIAAQPFKGHAGFHLWAAYSLFSNACWANLAAEWLRVNKDPVLLRTYTNLVLGETWEHAAETLDGLGLMGRGENYGPTSIPTQVESLNAGIDTHGDRLELTIVGWGDRTTEESWVISHEVIHGDPAQGYVWAELEARLLATYWTQSGRELRIRTTCIDSGGHHASQVLNFCKSRWHRRVYACKGASGARPVWPVRVSKTRSHERVFIIGVDTAKEDLYSRLRINKPGPGYIHFPIAAAFDQEYFNQLTSEQIQTRKKMGRPYRVWILPPNRRNEALDCFVLAYAAHKSEQRERHLVPTVLATVAPPPPMPAMAGVRITTVDPKPRFSRIREMARRMNPPR